MYSTAAMTDPSSLSMDEEEDEEDGEEEGEEPQRNRHHSS
jgi:hypothetical protein